MGLNEKFFKSADEEAGPFFNTVLYDGQSTNLSVTGVGFQPDLVWVKCRDVPNSHVLADSVRGGDGIRLYSIFPNLTNSESSSNQIETIDTDGFTVFGDKNATNRANQEYVAWCFKAGGAAVSNTDGSITSQVSANVDNGFSIVKWSGNNSVSNIGHGLSSAPQIVIRKNLLSTLNWAFDTSVVDGSWDYLFLNTTAAKANHSSITAPTSTTFNTGGTAYNGSSMIAYCFHSVAGVSKVGSFVGTGAAGNAQDIGFEPSWIMFKPTAGLISWYILDVKRNSFDDNLLANSTATEGSLNLINTTSTGFEFLGAGLNNSGVDILYYAIA